MIYALLLFFILFLDQFTKCAVAANQTDVEVIKNLFSITLRWNDGAAFSLFSDKGWAQTFFIVLTVIVLVVLYFIYIKMGSGKKWLKTTFIFIIAGALGNFIDRVAYSQVVDFIFVHFFPAVFNVADISLCVGCAMLVFYYLFLDKDALIKSKKKVENDKPLQS